MAAAARPALGSPVVALTTAGVPGRGRRNATAPHRGRAHLISRDAETQRFVVAANVAHPEQHRPSMIVSPRGEVLAEATGGGPARLEHALDLGAVRDDYLGQRRADVVSVSYLPTPGVGSR
ncbi:MAG: hypothetical protein GEV10_10590 [Streptosporangiales bacterium]|nr:hypothetical protein [Streptosporangiales bacterium]